MAKNTVNHPIPVETFRRNVSISERRNVSISERRNVSISERRNVSISEPRPDIIFYCCIKIGFRLVRQQKKIR